MRKLIGIILGSFVFINITYGVTTTTKEAPKGESREVLAKESSSQYSHTTTNNGVKESTSNLKTKIAWINYLLESRLNDINDKTNKENQVTLSFAGDTTLGTYHGQGKGNRFDEIYAQEGDAYFFEHVYPIFAEDDLTIINLEGPLTATGDRQEKQFAIRGEPHYNNILAEGAIEVVGLANNHTYDYGKEGYQQTKYVLEEKGIGYFGEDVTYYEEVNGITIACIGAKGWSNSQYTKDILARRIEEAKEQADLVIMMFHWGTEREHYANKIQQDLAYYVIDQGVDLVVGSHPHVIQGIEKYKGKSIVYSLGNFSFGANKNPSDKDTFIYQETFKLTEEGIETVDSQVIPCRISSVTTRNDYRPTPLEGEAADKVLARMEQYSSHFNESYFD